MILGVSVLIPLGIAAVGFSALLGSLGVVSYLAFLVHSLTGAGGNADGAAKKDEDIDLEGMFLSKRCPMAGGCSCDDSIEIAD